MSQLTTYLEYTCVPSPLMLGETQDIIVIATLKTAEELGIALTSATISNLVLNFGPLGTGATNLTNTTFTIANIEAPNNWTVAVSGASCTLTPQSGYGLVTTNAIVVVIKNVAVNAAQGNVTLTVSEAATPAPQTGVPLKPSTTTTNNPGIESIVLPKMEAGDTSVTISADPENVTAGASTVLSWSGGSASATFSLNYISNGNLTTITQHANGTALQGDDVYPNLNLTPSDPVLTVNSNTIFVLQIQDTGGENTYVTTPVIAAQPNIYANSVQVPYPLSANQNGLLVGNPNDLNGNYAALAVVMSNGAPAWPLAVINSTGSSIFTVDQNANTNMAGNLSAAKANISGNVTAGSFIGNGIVPIGGIIPFAGFKSSIQNGWLLCNGRAISRTIYASLFQAIGVIYGNGDGSTTFNLPDYRGMFLRGVDYGAGLDPDSASRFSQPGGTAVGDTVGSRQNDELISHNHSYQMSTYGVNTNWSGDDWGNSSNNTSNTGGNETRPKNVYVNYIIRVL